MKHRKNTIFKVISVLVVIAFSCDQLTFAQGLGNKNISASYLNSKLRTAVAEVQRAEGQVPEDPGERLVFPFLMHLVGDALVTEIHLNSDYTPEALKNLINETLVTRIKDEHFDRYDLGSIRRDKGSILIPLKSGLESVRFFREEDTDNFASDKVVKKWEISLPSPVTGRREKIFITKISLDGGNVASGFWPEEAHDALNGMIGELIGTEDDVTSSYDQKKIKKGLKQAIAGLKASIPPEIADVAEEAIKAVDPKMDLDSFVSALLKLCDNPRFKCFFLRPLNKEDHFSFMFKGEGKRPLPLSAYAHFGHNGTKGKKREENVYIASPYYDFVEESAALGLVAHEMTHLVFGKGDQAHFLAEVIEKAISYSHETEAGTTKELGGYIGNYINAKDSLLKALEREEREEALEAFKAWKEAINQIADKDTSEFTLALAVYDQINRQIGPAVRELVSEITKAGMDAAAQEKAVDRVFRKHGIGMALSGPILTVMGSLAGMPLPPDQVTYYVMMNVSKLISVEIYGASHASLPGFMEELVDEVVEETVTALYDDDAARSHWRKQLKSVILPAGVENLFPEEFFRAGVFEQKKEYIAGMISTLPMMYSEVLGANVPEIDRVLIRPNPNYIETRSTLMHELIHYLSDHDQIKLDPAFEFATYAMDLCNVMMRSRDGDIKAAEEVMETYQKKFVPGFKKLYMRGREIYEKGESVHILRPGETSQAGAYYSTDLLVIEAIKEKEKHGFPVTHLRQYLAGKNTEMASPLQINQFMQDKYFTQEDCGLLLAGMLIARYEKEGVHPLRAMRDYFAELHDVMGRPTGSDARWLDKELFPEMKTLARQLFGKKAELVESDVTDRLGLWFADTDRWGATIKYWPFTIYPRDRKAEDRALPRQEARERGIGNLLLAFYRAQHTKDEDIEKAHPGRFDSREFSLLWEALLIPRAIYMAVPAIQRKVEREKDLGMYRAVSDLIQKVFDEKYDLGSRTVEQELFDSYPLHLQFLDSILYRWSRYDPEKDGDKVPEDPRVKPGSRVDQALAESFDGWTRLMFRVGDYSGYEEIFSVMEEKIWPAYKKLFDEDVEIEKDRRAIQQGEKQGAIQPGQMDPNDLTPEEKEYLKDLFDSLPDEVKQEIIRQIMEQLNSSSLGSQGQGIPVPAGQGQKGARPGDQPADGQPSGMEAIKQQLENLDNRISGMEGMLDKISESSQSVGQGADNIGKGAPSAGAAAPDRGKIDELDESASGLQEETGRLKREGERLKGGAEDMVQDAFDQAGELPAPGMGEKVREEASEFGQDAGEINDKIKELQDKINRLRKLTKRLKDISDKGGDPTQISEVAEGIREEVDKIKQTTGSIGDKLDGAEGSLKDLQDAVSDLAGQVDEIERSAEGRKPAPEKGEGTKAKDGPSKPSKDEAGEGESEGESAEAAEPGEPSSTEPSTEPSLTSGKKMEGGSKSLSSLKQIIDSARSEEVEVKDRFKGKFESKVDPAWAEIQRKQELLQEMEMTGLNEEELREYKEWMQMLDPELVDNMTDVVKGLVLPAEETQKFWSRYTGILKKPIRQLFGGAGFAKRVETKPTPVKLSLLFDTSGSMWEGNRLLYAKLSMLIMLEVIFRVNAELEKKGWPLIEFEIGFFDEDAEPFISHETSARIGEHRKVRLIYDAIQYMQANGGTDDAKALGGFVTRLKESPEPVGAEEKAKRVLFQVGDGNVDQSDKSELRGVLEFAGENDVDVFGVSVGDRSAMQSVKDAFGDRAIIPRKSDLSDLPEKIVRAFAECLAPPSMQIPWDAILRNVSCVISPLLAMPAVSSLLSAMKHMNLARKHDQAEEEPPLRETGYRNFFYQETAGRDYLVWRRKDSSGRVHELRWQRGQGGVNVPDKVTVDDDENEKLMLKIIQSLHLQGVEYTSYSRDGQCYIREFEDRLFLMVKNESGAWEVKKEILLSKAPVQGKEEEGFKIFEKDGVKWRLDAMGNLFINTGGDNWAAVISRLGSFGEDITIDYAPDTNGYTITDRSNKRVLLAAKGDLEGQLEVSYDLMIDKFTEDREWEGQIVRLIGPTGVGKDELIRAAAHLMREEVYFVAGNEDMEPEDLLEYQTCGVKEGLTTGHLYTPYNHVCHNGGWVVIDEFNKVKSKVKGTVKTSAAAKTHQRWVRRNGKEELVKMKNHPRARFIATLNELTPDIAQSMPEDQAMQDRYTDIRFSWKTPSEEKEMQYQLALASLKRNCPDLSDAELHRRMKTLHEAADVLVDIAWPMRLAYAGYSAAQQAKLAADGFRDWKRLLQDDTFTPDSKTGAALKRAPSPRAIANMLEHAALFPGTWEHAPLTVAMFWFNFYVDDMKPQERSSAMSAIMDSFRHPPVRGGDGINDEDSLPAVRLTPDSFQLDGEYLVVTPEPVRAGGAEKDYWDPVRVKLHPDAVQSFRAHGLPEDLKYWLSTGNENNSRLLYFALQFRAMGKSMIFVGDQGAGKSFLASAIGRLLDGPDVPQLEIHSDTDKEDLTLKPYFREGVTGFDYGPVAVGLKDRKTVILEESTQGKPAVMAVLNEVIERQFMTLPDGSSLGREGDGAFGVIHAVNPPGSGDFQVKPMSGEFIERHPVLNFEILSAKDMLDFALAVSNDTKASINPRVVGEERTDENDRPLALEVKGVGAAPVPVSGVSKFDGLVGVCQYIIYKRMMKPLDKSLPPRAPGLRTLKKLIKHINSYWGSDSAFDDRSMQELLFERFLDNFVMHGTAQERAAWVAALREAFAEARLWSGADGEDALEEYLDGEEMLVQKLPVLRQPDSQDYKIDKILVYLQENTQGHSVAKHIELLDKELFARRQGWEGLDLPERLKRMHVMRDVWQILELICTKRKGRGFDCHSDENIERMRAIQDSIQAHVQDEKDEWPRSFLEREESWARLQEKWGDGLPPGGDRSVYNALGKIFVNIEDADFVADQIKSIVERLKKETDFDPFLHNISDSLAGLIAVYNGLEFICEKHPDNPKLEELKEAFRELFKKSPITPEEVDRIKESGVFEKLLQILSAKSGKYDENYLRCRFKTVLEEPFMLRHLDEALEEMSLTLPELYRAFVAEYILYPRTDPDSSLVLRDTFLKPAKAIYELWARKVKENQPVPEEEPAAAPSMTSADAQARLAEVRDEIARLEREKPVMISADMGMGEKLENALIEETVLFGEEGRGKGKFDNPEDTQIFTGDDGRLYALLVTDTGNNRLQYIPVTWKDDKPVFNKDEAVLFGKKGKKKGEFDSPEHTRILTGDDGRMNAVLVTDSRNDRIQYIPVTWKDDKPVFNKDEAVLFGKKGKKKGEFDSPEHTRILTGDDGRMNAVLVADTANHRLQYIPVTWKDDKPVFNEGEAVLFGKEGWGKGEFNCPEHTTTFTGDDGRMNAVLVADVDSIQYIPVTWKKDKPVFNKGEAVRFGNEHWQTEFSKHAHHTRVLTGSDGRMNGVLVTGSYGCLQYIPVTWESGKPVFHGEERTFLGKGDGVLRADLSKGKFNHPSHTHILTGDGGRINSVLVTDAGNCRLQYIPLPLPAAPEPAAPDTSAIDAQLQSLRDEEQRLARLLEVRAEIARLEKEKAAAPGAPSVETDFGEMLENALVDQAVLLGAVDADGKPAKGAGKGEFNYPIHIEKITDETGRVKGVLVSERVNNRLQYVPVTWGQDGLPVFDRDNAVIFGEKGAGKGEFYSPDHIEKITDGTGRVKSVLVGEKGNNRLQYVPVTWGPDGLPVFDKDNAVLFGEEGAGKGEFNGPEHIEKITDETGRVKGVLVAEWDSHRLQYVPVTWGPDGLPVFDKDNAVLFGEKGAGKGEFNGPEHIEKITDETGRVKGVFVLEYGNNRLQYIPLPLPAATEPAGPVSVELNPDFGDGGVITKKMLSFSDPNGIAVDAAGNIWVVNNGKDNIFVLKNDGTLNTAFGEGGIITQEMGGFGTPNGIAIDPAGNVWVVNQRTETVSVLRSDGTLNPAFGEGGIITKEMGGIERPDGIAIDRAGNVWITNFYSNTLSVLRSDGTLNTAFGEGGIITQEMGGFLSPFRIAIDRAGNIWVTNGENSTVSVLRSDGTLNTAFGEGGIITQEMGKFEKPGGIAIDRAGDVWVTNFNGNTVSVLKSDGTLNPAFGEGGIITQEMGRFDKPSAIAEDGAGNVWVTNWGKDPVSVLKVERPSEGRGISAIGSPESLTPLSSDEMEVVVIPNDHKEHISGFAVDPSGNYWVSSERKSLVTVYKPDGTLNEAIGDHGVISKENGKFNAPVSIKIDQDTGRIYVLNAKSGTISVLNGNGTLDTGINGNGIIQVPAESIPSDSGKEREFPRAMALDGDGFIIVFSVFGKYKGSEFQATAAGKGDREISTYLHKLGADDGHWETSSSVKFDLDLGSNYGMSHVYDMVIDEEGYIYVQAEDKIYRITPGLKLDTSVKAPLRYNSNRPSATPDPDVEGVWANMEKTISREVGQQNLRSMLVAGGSVFFTSMRGHSLIVLDRDAAPNARFRGRGKINGRPCGDGEMDRRTCGDLKAPQGIAMDVDGRIHVLSRGKISILSRKVDPDIEARLAELRGEEQRLARLLEVRDEIARLEKGKAAAPAARAPVPAETDFGEMLENALVDQAVLLGAVDADGKPAKGAGKGELDQPEHIEKITDETGRVKGVLVAEGGNDRLQYVPVTWGPDGLPVFDKDNAVLFGEEGAGKGEFNYPIHIEKITDETGRVKGVLVSEAGNHRLQYVPVTWGPDGLPVFDKDNAVLFGGYGAGKGEFSAPEHIEKITDETGRVKGVLVSEAGNHRLQYVPVTWGPDGLPVFDKDNAVLFGEEGAGKGEFNGPRDIGKITDGPGRVKGVLVAEHNNHRLQYVPVTWGPDGLPVFDKDNAVLFGEEGAGKGEFNSPIHIEKITDETGRVKGVLVAEEGNDRLQYVPVSWGPDGLPVFDKDNAVLFGGYGAGKGEFNIPRHIEKITDETGRVKGVLVTEHNNHRLQYIPLPLPAAPEGLADELEKVKQEIARTIDEMRRSPASGVERELEGLLRRKKDLEQRIAAVKGPMPAAAPAMKMEHMQGRIAAIKREVAGVLSNVDNVHPVWGDDGELESMYTLIGGERIPVIADSIQPSTLDLLREWVDLERRIAELRLPAVEQAISGARAEIEAERPDLKDCIVEGSAETGILTIHVVDPANSSRIQKHQRDWPDLLEDIHKYKEKTQRGEAVSFEEKLPVLLLEIIQMQKEREKLREYIPPAPQKLVGEAQKVLEEMDELRPGLERSREEFERLFDEFLRTGTWAITHDFDNVYPGTWDLENRQYELEDRLVDAIKLDRAGISRETLDQIIERSETDRAWLAGFLRKIGQVIDLAEAEDASNPITKRILPVLNTLKAERTQKLVAIRNRIRTLKDISAQMKDRPAAGILETGPPAHGIQEDWVNNKLWLVEHGLEAEHRRMAARSLGEMGVDEQRVVDALTKAAEEDESPHVQEACREALRELEQLRAETDVRELSPEDEARAEELRKKIKGLESRMSSLQEEMSKVQAEIDDRTELLDIAPPAAKATSFIYIRRDIDKKRELEERLGRAAAEKASYEKELSELGSRPAPVAGTPVAATAEPEKLRATTTAEEAASEAARLRQELAEVEAEIASVKTEISSVGSEEPAKTRKKVSLNPDFGKGGVISRRDGGFDGPLGILVDHLGNLYISCERNDHISRLKPDGTLDKFSRDDAFIVRGEGKFDRPMGMAQDGERNIWVANWGNGTVSVIRHRGAINGWYGKDGVIEDDSFDQPRDIAIDHSGNAWVTYQKGNTITVLNSKGERNTEIGEDGVITREMGAFDWPAGIAIDKDGNIWVTNYGNGTISVLKEDGTLNKKFGDGGVIKKEISGLDSPVGITRDAEGNMWVADWQKDMLVVFGPDGTLNAEFGENGVITKEMGDLDKPNSIAIDKDGNIWVANYENDAEKAKVCVLKVEEEEHARQAEDNIGVFSGGLYELLKNSGYDPDRSDFCKGDGEAKWREFIEKLQNGRSAGFRHTYQGGLGGDEYGSDYSFSGRVTGTGDGILIVVKGSETVWDEDGAEPRDWPTLRIKRGSRGYYVVERSDKPEEEDDEEADEEEEEEAEEIRYKELMELLEDVCPNLKKYFPKERLREFADKLSKEKNADIHASVEDWLEGTVKISGADILITVEWIEERYDSQDTVIKLLVRKDSAGKMYSLVEPSELVARVARVRPLHKKLKNLEERREQIKRELEEALERAVVSPIPEALIDGLWLMLTVRNTEYLQEACDAVAANIRRFSNAPWLKEILGQVRGFQSAGAIEMLDRALDPEEEKDEDSDQDDGELFPAYAERTCGGTLKEALAAGSLGEPCEAPEFHEERSLILYADDILNNAVLTDLEAALKKYVGEKKILNGGKIVLYVKEKELEEKTEQLRALIENTVPDTRVLVIKKRDHRGMLGKKADSPEKEIRGLMRCINSKREKGEAKIEEKNVLAVIRGNDIDWTEANLKYDLEVPLIVINSNTRGIFSFAQALEVAIRTVNQETGFTGWIRELKPIVSLTSDMYDKYLRYRDEVLTRA